MKDTLITHINKFVSLSEEEAAEVAACIDVIKLKKKEFVLEPGEVCRAYYFVVKGCMRLYFVNRSGQEQITQFGIENWWITDHGSLETGKPSTYYLQAIEDTEVISLNKKAFDELLVKTPRMERYFRFVFQKALTAVMRRIEYFRDQSDEERYRYFVSLFPGFVQRIPQYMLAAYLGFTPQFLSKIRGRKVRKSVSPKDNPR